MSTPTKHYYYRPLQIDGTIYKCAGHGAEDPQHRAFYELYFNTEEDCQYRGLRPGVIILEGYRGDRIRRNHMKGGWEVV